MYCKSKSFFGFALLSYVSHLKFLLNWFLYNASSMRHPTVVPSYHSAFVFVASIKPFKHIIPMCIESSKSLSVRIIQHQIQFCTSADCRFNLIKTKHFCMTSANQDCDTLSQWLEGMEGKQKYHIYIFTLDSSFVTMSLFPIIHPMKVNLCGLCFM